MLNMSQQRVAALINSRSLMQFSQKSISSKATFQKKTEDVNLRGHFLQGRAADLPTLIWFADLCEPVSNFKNFFSKADNKILDYRNVWLVDHRNFGESDHHKSFDLHEMGEDVIRFMDKNEITLATIGGHGFGAKVATVTAVDNLNRFTGLMLLDGGPIDHKHHESYNELESYVNAAKQLNLSECDLSAANKYLDQHIECPKWR